MLKVNSTAELISSIYYSNSLSVLLGVLFCIITDLVIMEFVTILSFLFVWPWDGLLVLTSFLHLLHDLY